MHYKKSNRQRPTKAQVEATLTFYKKSYDINRKNIQEVKSSSK
jgi:hypothetical protein